MNTSVIPHDRARLAPRDLDADVQQVLSRKFTDPKPAVSTAMRELDDLGRMSAEAVLTQYEATAKAVEEMGNDVKEMVKKLGYSLIECDNDMKVVAETAAAIREKGKHSQALIEQVSALSSSIRAACEEFKKKVGV
jgi:hypothetical protein